MKACPTELPTTVLDDARTIAPPAFKPTSQSAVAAKYKKIGLLDHMGWGNMGDAAIQEAFIANIGKRLPDAELVAFSLYPEDTRKRHNLRSYPIIWSYPKESRSDADAEEQKPSGFLSRIKSSLKRLHGVYSWAKPAHDFICEATHLARSYKAVKSLDLLIMSGGGQLCELWQGPWSHPYNVFKFCFLAKLARVPVFIVSVGAGPLDHPLSKFFARWAVRLARYTSFRDVESQALIRSLGTGSESEVYPDPAYSLDLARYVPATTKTSGNRKVGLNPIGFCDPRRWPRKDEAVYQRYLDVLAEFTSWLVDNGYSVEIFTNEISVDCYAIHDLEERVRRTIGPIANSRVTVLPNLALNEVLTQVAGFDFVVTSKFHGVVFSHLLEKPVVALSYHPKIDDLMRAVGHSEYCLDIERCDSQSLATAFAAVVENQAALKSLFHKKTASYASALRVQFDNLFAGAGH